MEGEGNKIDPSQAAIISIIAVMMIGEKATTFEGKKVNKIDLLEYHLKKSYILDTKVKKTFDQNSKQFIKTKENVQVPIFNNKCAKVLRTMQGTYENWKMQVFKNQDSYESLKKINKICQAIACNSSHDFTKFKNAIKKYLEGKDCDFTEELAYTCSIVSLLHLAVDYCELAKKNYGQFSDVARSLTAISPAQFKKNCLSMYPLLYAPKDIDVNDSPEVLKAIVELGDSIYSKYCANFTSVE